MGKPTINEAFNGSGRSKFLTLMSKIRATQTLGATLTSKGNHVRASAMYKKLINDSLSMREHFTRQQQKTLESALSFMDADPPQDDQAVNQAWKMRSAIDTVYDECISDFNDVQSAMPSNLQSVIKDTINLASDCVANGNLSKAFMEYTKLLKQMKQNQKYKDLVSLTAKNLVDGSLCFAETSTEDMSTKVRKLRDSLDRVYNEIRLPDVYAPSLGPLQKLNKREKWQKKKGLMVIDFRQKDGSLFQYGMTTCNDRVMGGSSEANTQFDEVKECIEFSGSLSKKNRGGFASVRILPDNKDEMKELLSGTKAISLEVMNLDTKNIRYKFQMANEAHLKSFNWQAEFIVEPDGEWHTVVLDLYSFWPTMFGHVLSSPGNVDFSKVDFLGVLISHVTVDGKFNPDFVEGTFGLGVRSLSLIKDEDES
eukprot:TCONS_00069075-protein